MKLFQSADHRSWRQTITHDASGAVIRFEIEATRKEALMSGLDPIGATLQSAEDIRAFEARHKLENPWFPAKA